MILTLGWPGLGIYVSPYSLLPLDHCPLRKTIQDVPITEARFLVLIANMCKYASPQLGKVLSYAGQRS